MQSDWADLAISQLTIALGDALAGQEDAIRAVVEVLRGYAERRFISRMRPDHSLEAMLLADHAFMELFSTGKYAFPDRARFFSAAAIVIRNFVIDYRRRQKAKKRGGGRARVEMSDVVAPCADPLDEIARRELDILFCEEMVQAMEQLALDDAQSEQAFLLRHYAGMTQKEIAALLGLDVRKINQKLGYAERWLKRELQHLKPEITGGR